MGANLHKDINPDGRLDHRVLAIISSILLERNLVGDVTRAISLWTYGFISKGPGYDVTQWSWFAPDQTTKPMSFDAAFILSQNMPRPVIDRTVPTNSAGISLRFTGRRNTPVRHRVNHKRAGKPLTGRQKGSDKVKGRSPNKPVKRSQKGNR